MLTHEQMPLTDTFGRSIELVDHEEHAKHWCRAQRREIAEKFQAIREEIHALKVQRRVVEQLEDEIVRSQNVEAAE